jgi:hypothetical protein
VVGVGVGVGGRAAGRGELQGWWTDFTWPRAGRPDKALAGDLRNETKRNGDVVNYISSYRRLAGSGSGSGSNEGSEANNQHGTRVPRPKAKGEACVWRVLLQACLVRRAIHSRRLRRVGVGVGVDRACGGRVPNRARDPHRCLRGLQRGRGMQAGRREGEWAQRRGRGRVRVGCRRAKQRGRRLGRRTLQPARLWSAAAERRVCARACV